MADRLRLPQALPNRHNWDAIVTALRALLPDIQGVVLYGSRISGYAGNTSDYDVLGVVHDPAVVRRRSTLGRELNRRTGLRVDLNLATLRGLELHLLLDPYIQYCLVSGVRIGLPELPETPLSRQGLVDALIEIELDLEDARSQSSESFESASLRRIAKQIAVLEQAAHDGYDANVYTNRVAALTSGTAAEVLGNLVRATEHIKERILALPPNSSDAALRQRLHETAHP